MRTLYSNLRLSSVLVLTFVVATLSNLSNGQKAAGISEAAAQSELGHAMEHEEQINSILTKKLTTNQQKQEFATQSRVSIHAVLGPETTQLVPQEKRDLAKKFSEVKTPGDLGRLVISLQSQGVTPSEMLPFLQPVILTHMQVVETKAPAFSLRPPSTPGGATALKPVSCPNIYTDLSNSILQNAQKVVALSQSVGRLEVLEPGKSPSSKGTAFVFDQGKGLIVTACHVVDALADSDPQTGNWTLPKKTTPSATIRIDFGDTNQHDPALEFAVTKVVYVPNLTGCDGAILSVDKTNVHGGNLPSALPLANKEPIVAPDHELDVISIGYPDFTELDGTTPDTANYFQCVSHSGTSDGAKFVFGGDVTADELMGGYHLQTHVVPTTSGQSGSPIIDMSDPTKPTVIGIHICCVVGTAFVTGGPDCQQRNEPYLEESVSVIDLARLFEASQSSVTASIAKPRVSIPSKSLTR